ncbi:hypothetical protein EYF80_010006 [Liparis tanakae]|uniref:Uncharacterized protein n=1 Tax=Liparis tanakae TaxID=230148 RepID=A0A4Z2IRA8_9TELE|nr:hypothetical protein EYF80_010006 [Liparis tanakae]
MDRSSWEVHPRDTSGSDCDGQAGTIMGFTRTLSAKAQGKRRRTGLGGKGLDGQVCTGLYPHEELPLSISNNHLKQPTSHPPPYKVNLKVYKTLMPLVNDHPPANPTPTPTPTPHTIPLLKAAINIDERHRHPTQTPAFTAHHTPTSPVLS